MNFENIFSKNIGFEYTITILNIKSGLEKINQTSYRYETDELIKFEHSFVIKPKTFHDCLFGKVILNILLEKRSISAAIYLHDFFQKKEGEAIYDLIDHKEVSEADHYKRIPNSKEAITIKFTKKKVFFQKSEAKKVFGVLKKILFYMLNKETANNILEITNLSHLILEGSKFSKIKGLLGIFLTEYHYKQKMNKSIEENNQHLSTDYDLLDCLEATKIKRMLDYSAAAFQDSLIMRLTLGKYRKTANDVKIPTNMAILELVNIKEDQILKAFKGDSSMVGFIICYEGDELIISFRGSHSTSDFIHDLNSSYISFLDGYTHYGFLNLLEKFIKNEWVFIEDQIAIRKIKRILITGYSLGGAIGILLHLALKSIGCNIHIETRVFSAPPTVSKNISSKNIEGLYVYSYGVDIVSRISYGSLLDYKYICLSFSSRWAISEGISQLEDKFSEISAFIKNLDRYPKLYHPGLLTHIKCINIKDEKKYGVEIVGPNYFVEFKGLAIVPFDHFLNRFYEAFIYFMENIKGS